jgi:hypothetical protein
MATHTFILATYNCLAPRNVTHFTLKYLLLPSPFIRNSLPTPSAMSKVGRNNRLLVCQSEMAHYEAEGDDESIASPENEDSKDVMPADDEGNNPLRSPRKSLGLAKD